MQLSVHFNWPLGENSANVELGGPNVNDVNIEFRLGVVPGDQPTMVYWHENEWVVGDEEMQDMKVRVKRNDVVIVERRNKDTKEIVSRNTWNIAESWPPEAHGASMTVVPWYF